MVCPSGEMALKRIHSGLVWAVAPIAINKAAIKAVFLLLFILLNHFGFVDCCKGS